jgi:putative hemolysin
MRVLYYSTGSGGSWNVGVSDATGSANWQKTTSAIGMNYGTNLQAEGEVDEATNYIGGFGKTYAATLTSIQNYPTETSTGANPNLGSPLGSSNSNYKYCATQDGSLSTSSNLENYTVSAVGSC